MEKFWRVSNFVKTIKIMSSMSFSFVFDAKLLLIVHPMSC